MLRPWPNHGTLRLPNDDANEHKILVPGYSNRQDRVNSNRSPRLQYQFVVVINSVNKCSLPNVLDTAKAVCQTLYYLYYKRVEPYLWTE